MSRSLITEFSRRGTAAVVRPSLPESYADDIFFEILAYGDTEEIHRSVSAALDIPVEAVLHLFSEEDETLRDFGETYAVFPLKLYTSTRNCLSKQTSILRVYIGSKHLIGLSAQPIDPSHRARRNLTPSGPGDLLADYVRHTVMGAKFWIGHSFFQAYDNDDPAGSKRKRTRARLERNRLRTEVSRVMADLERLQVDLKSLLAMNYEWLTGNAKRRIENSVKLIEHIQHNAASRLGPVRPSWERLNRHFGRRAADRET